ncbi:putative tubulin-specific chaperone c [Aspergillus clavatus NRRL 1]|uniref:Tubulin-specific chaperone c, putative n=1 Tax=Aspergillus clavatus (strain ATCC 1007 / CBS 513.65 / DSM 816 / NCTC 3887 / NRRL 1 / QM 1276 / 107) TaxID=344612 RepID=A1CK09_ASPCL|nr:tubulin-specific chaperone c, putative [Aspergillus clavatus NRRL 1]EAW09483.1 tubulin-specific chaperone c, putative [Aspergillus clavatus NRRL 1]
MAQPAFDFDTARRPSQAENQTILKSEIPLKERFFRYFQHEITALQEQMDRLADTSLVGGERTDATDHCLAGVARLSNEVKDAASYIPTYDQRIYAEAIKALQDKLAETRAAVEPRPKFTFKTKKNTSAVSLSDAAQLVVQGHGSIPGYRSPGASSVNSSAGHTPNYPSTPLYEPDFVQLQRPEIAPTSVPVFSADMGTMETKPKEDAPKGNAFAATSVSSVSVNDHYGLHIMLPASGSTATVPSSITSLHHCVVDMSIPTANGKPYASLTINGVKESLLICGQIDGPAHITGVENSVIVVSCRQFRMHNCTDVDVYLSSSSNPIIEDCSNIRFGRIPRAYALDHDRRDNEDRWSQVEDFKWIKPEPSPNWSLLSSEESIPEQVWAEIVPGGPGWSLDDILRAIKIVKD